MNNDRHLSIFNPENFQDKKILIVGAGAIGSALVETLTRIGMNNITIIDDDNVEEVNISNQSYFFDDIGKSKVEAAVSKCRRINPELNIRGIKRRFIKSMGRGYDIIFSAVDNMKTRETIFNSAQQFAKIYIDGRMAGTEYSVFAVNLDRETEIKNYRSTLFPDNEGVQLRCSEKSIIYNTFAIAADMVNQLTKILQHEPHQTEIAFDFSSNQRITF